MFIRAASRVNPIPAPRTTQSNKVYSPWEVYNVTRANPLFNLEALVEAKAQHDSLYPDGLLEEDEALIEANKPNTGPEPSAAPLPTLPDEIQQELSPHPSASTSHPSDLNLKPVEAAEEGLSSKEHRRRQEDDTVKVPMVIDSCKVASSGFTGPRDGHVSQANHLLSYFTGKGSTMGFTFQEWNGNSPLLLVDGSRQLVGVLSGHPNDTNWPSTIHEATDALESARQELHSRENKAGRQGAFSSLQCGVSHGGGQKQPGNLHNHAEEKDILTRLNSLSCFNRTSSFSSSVMATRAPDLFQEYATKMGKLYDHDKNLKRPFPGSIQSAATYNLGPQTVCSPHHDSRNYACSICSITPYGDFDYKKGGHLVLWECRLVVEFPPGCTILIPSALIAHSNTAIQQDETRYSFTQYTAGALFRWVENDFQKVSTYQQSLSPEERKKAKEQDTKCWQESLLLLPVIPAPKKTPMPS